MRALFALLGAGLAVAAWLIVTGLRSRPVPAGRDRPRRRPAGTHSTLRIVGALTAAAVVGAATRWPVAALLAGAAAWLLPPVLGPDTLHRRSLERVEAIAAWAEDLAGTLQGAAGIEQAILETAASAPAEIRTELDPLVEAIRAGVRLPQALRALADELGDPTADLVINVLLQAAAHQARDIATGLSGVGRAARRQASMRMRVAAGRARIRTSTRIVITVVITAAVLLAMFAQNLLRPYGTPLGQVILAVLGAGFGGALVWMVRTGRIEDLPRILTRTPAAEEPGGGS
ncbi:MAG TPA: type II secretion protein F [Micromonosporaceae bacterium]|nr:type II secretion protein F [Micromonosporaceae bacterium]